MELPTQAATLMNEVKGDLQAKTEYQVTDKANCEPQNNNKKVTPSDEVTEGKKN